MTFAPADFFPSDADDARQRFGALCEQAGLEIWTIGDPETDGFVIEAARIGSPDAPSVLVLTCGEGESEGLCASGIQCAALAGPVRRELPRDVGMLFIHTIAPKWVGQPRKADFSVPSRAWEDTLLAAAENRYEEYLRQKRAASSEDAGASDEAKIAADDASEEKTPEQELQALIDEHLGRAERIGVIDIRTGPGAYGRCDLVACAGAASPAGRRAKLWFGARTAAESSSGKNEADDDTPSAVPGPLAQSLITLLPPVELTAVVMEFGTYSLEVMLGSVPGRMFYPVSEKWRDMVWARAYRVIQRGMKALAGT